MNPLWTAYSIAKGVGFDNVPRRVWQMWRVRSGALRRQMDPARFSTDHLPVSSMTGGQVIDHWGCRSSRFLRIPEASELHSLVPPSLWKTRVTDVCERALAGDYQFFSRWFAPLGWPLDFNLDPVNDVRWPVGEPWLPHARSGPPRNDIKLVWESSRLTLAFYFARAYRYSGDERWAAAFWQMFDAWVEQNPVNESVAWGCGQEVSFRLMPMLTAAFATLKSDSATADRLRRLEQLCWQSGRRIEFNLNYAISQENNHALSEAMGLWTLGLLFTEFPESVGWIRLASRVLSREASRQIYPDGSYVQNSFSYHRVMLDDLMWVVRLAQINAHPVPTPVSDGLTRATEWLSEFVDRRSGRVPNYGANDGANVLPLSCSDYLDYRPTLRAAGAIFGTEFTDLGQGPWDEKSLWLTGTIPSTPRSPRPEASRWHAPTGGYFILRGPCSHAMVRATTYRDRPSQCDLLHMDLWYRGDNILRDAGSYRYYHEDPRLKNYFYSTEAHNTLQVDALEQMQKGPAFLWFEWPKASGEFVDESTLHCQARYGRGQSRWKHFRRVHRDGDSYVVHDQRLGGHTFTVRWRLTPEVEWKLEGQSVFGEFSDDTGVCLHFESDLPLDIHIETGMESLYYGELRDCPVVVAHGRGNDVTTTVSFATNAVAASSRASRASSL